MRARAAAEEHSHGARGRIATVGSYATLGAVLVASRSVGLNLSFWTDEIIAVEDFIRRGPSEILAGPDLNHELFALLAWLTTTLVGESEVAVRLWSVVPFLAGVALVTTWLHVRIGALSGLFFLFLATTSPLLLDITRQGRGYGLALLAMSVLVVAGLESCRADRVGPVLAFCGAGLVGALTLPQFAIGFVAASVVLLVISPRPRRVGTLVAASLVAIAAFYSPHLGEVREASQIQDGVQISTLWLLTAPLDQILLPALIWIDGTALVAGVVWLPVVLLALTVMAWSPLARRRDSALLLCSAPVATIIVLWLADAYVIPRYTSYLLVPLFVLVATGAAALFERGLTRSRLVPATVCVVVAALLVLRFAVLAPDVMLLPREANRDAADAVLAREPPTLTVLAYMRNPRNLEHYLGRDVVPLRAADVSRRVCASRQRIAYVAQPFALGTVEPPCLAGADVERRRFEQYARGGETTVWIVSPR